MTCNVGGIERPIRIVAGLLLIGIGAFAGLSAIGTAFAHILGVVMLVTGAIGFCPLSALFGINTCSTMPAAKK